MSDWLSKNAWALIIAGITMVSSYAIYGYRIDDLDKRVTANATAISTLSDNNLQVQVSLAKIQTDIEYIKVQLDKITK